MLQKSIILLCLIVTFKFSGTQRAIQRKIVTINEEQEKMLRQSQNTFVQWVQSLLPQRPTYEMLTGSSITTTAVATLKPIQAISIATTPTPPTASIAPTIIGTTLKPLNDIAQNTLTPIIKPTSIITTIRATTTRTTIAATAAVTATTIEAKPTSSPVVSAITVESILLNPPRNCTECFCGIANIQKRIVGGQETEVNQYPWMSMLLYGGRFYCAGTLINDQYVVTASHCVYGFRRERITVRLLEHDRKLSGIHKIDRRIVEIITHPKYNARTYDNDIAIVKLEEPVELTELLHPVCLPTPGKSFKGELGIVTGWGALKVGGPTSDTLQEVHVPIMSQEACRQSRYGSSRITDNMLCAGFDEGKKDSCQGDSGGPLHIVAPGTREHQLAGVVSWGEGCAKAGYPGVYARVNRYGTWIKSMTKNACICISEAKKIKKSL